MLRIDSPNVGKSVQSSLTHESVNRYNSEVLVGKEMSIMSASINVQRHSDQSQFTNAEIRIGEAVQKRQYHHVIRMIERYGRLDSPLDGIRQLHILNPRVTTPILNYYLTALVHLRYLPEIEEAMTLFKSEDNRRPNRRTYALLLRAYIQSLNLRKARLLLFEMINRGFKIDKGVVHTVLQGEGKWAISMESVDKFLQLLSSSNVQFGDMTSYNIIVDAYLRRDRPDKARAVLDKIMGDGFQPDAETFLALMRYQARKEGSRGVSVIFNSLSMSGIALEQKHFNVLLSTLTRERSVDLKEAVSLCSTYNLTPDLATCNIVLRSLLSRKFSFDDLQAHFKEMERLNIHSDTYTFTILLNEYKYKSRRWQRAQKVVQQQSLLNPTHVNRITNNVLLHYMISISPKSTRNQLSSPLLLTDSDLRLQWDIHTLTALVAAYSRSKDWSRIADLHRKLERREVKLDRHFYRVLVEALLTGKKYKESKEAASRLLASDEILDQLFGYECMIRIAHTLVKSTGCGKENLLESIDRFLKFSDTKGVTISEKRCNLVAIACLDIHRQDLAIELLESRYHLQGRFQDLEGGKKLGMSSWTILMRAYARKEKNKIPNLRSCVDRALSNESQLPTRTFLNFLHHLGANAKLRWTDAEACDFFLQKRLEYVIKRRSAAKESHRRGRSHLTKANILRWVNDLG